MVHVLMHGERHSRIRAIDRAGRREHEMLDAVVPATLEHRHRADEVARDVCEGCGDAVAHASLRAEMNHSFELLRGEEPGDRVLIGKFDLDELERGYFERIARRACLSETS